MLERRVFDILTSDTDLDNALFALASLAKDALAWELARAVVDADLVRTLQPGEVYDVLLTALRVSVVGGMFSDRAQAHVADLGQTALRPFVTDHVLEEEVR